MTIDLDRYRLACIPAVKAILDREPLKDRLELIGVIAVTLNCPIIAVGHFIMEIEGYTGTMNDKIDRDIKFYKIDEVRGKKAYE